MNSVTLSDGTRNLVLSSTGTGTGEGIRLREFQPPIPQTENTYATGADAEGQKRVRARPQNATGSMLVSVAGTAFLDDLDNLQDLVASAHREKATLAWDLAGTAITADLESIQIVESPVGQGVMWERDYAEFAVEFETLPYGRLPQETVFSSVSVDGPIAGTAVDLSAYPAHAELWGELTVTDDNAANVNYDLVEFGYELDGYNAASPSGLILVGDTDLVLTDYAGTGNQTQTGGHAGANNGITATLVTDSVVVCGTGSQPHVGRKRITARLQVNTGAVKVRLKWRVGDGQYRTEPWRTVPGEDTWADVDLAVIDIEQALAGTHAWDGLVEAKGEALGDVLWVDYVEIVPAEVWGRASAVASDAQEAPLYYDLFNQSAGDLTGETIGYGGGTWTGDGDGDYIANTGNAGDPEDGIWGLQRTAVSDSSEVPRYQVVGSALSTVSVQVAFRFSALHAGRLGVLARYGNSGNWLLGYQTPGAGASQLVVKKRVAGTITTLAYTGSSSWFAVVGQIYVLKLTTDAAGNWALYWDVGQSKECRYLVLSGNDPDLATGAALDDGAIGIYDYAPFSTVCTRNYDNFITNTLAGAISYPALYDDQSIRFTHESAERENAAGSAWGRVPKFEGQHLRLPPATRNGHVGRLALRVRTRTEGQTATGDVTDGGAMTLKVTPRVLLT